MRGHLSYPRLSLRQLTKGDFAVPGWKSTAILAQSIAKFYIGKAGDGPPHVITVYQVDNTMIDLVQDSSTTDWTITPIVKETTPKVVPIPTKRSVYYAEVAVIDQNGLKMPGGTE